MGGSASTPTPTTAACTLGVVVEGTVRPGDPIAVTPPIDDTAERHATTTRIDRAERASNLALWRAAAAAGHRVEVVDDGALAIAAAPELPGSAFNLGIGFADMPHLLSRARDHFAAHGVIGWAWADTAPWPGAAVDSTAVYAAAAVEAVTAGDPPAGVVVRRLGRDEIGAWGAIVEAAGGWTPQRAARSRTSKRTWRTRRTTSRFVAELDGRAVGAGSLHTHHHVGWLRAGVVLPEARGRGIQRALIRERAALAGELGCDLIGASANAGGVSARNLRAGRSARRCGARPVPDRSGGADRLINCLEPDARGAPRRAPGARSAAAAGPAAGHAGTQLRCARRRVRADSTSGSRTAAAASRAGWRAR